MLGQLAQRSVAPLSGFEGPEALTLFSSISTLQTQLHFNFIFNISTFKTSSSHLFPSSLALILLRISKRFLHIEINFVMQLVLTSCRGFRDGNAVLQSVCPPRWPRLKYRNNYWIALNSTYSHVAYLHIL